MLLQKRNISEEIFKSAIANGETFIFSRFLRLISSKKIWKKYSFLKSYWTNSDYQEAFDKMHDEGMSSIKFYYWAKSNKLSEKFLKINKNNKINFVDKDIDFPLEEFLYQSFFSKTNRIISILKDIKKIYVYFFKLILNSFKEIIFKSSISFKGVYIHNPPLPFNKICYPEWISSVLEDEKGTFRIHTSRQFNLFIFKKTKNKNNKLNYVLEKNYNGTPHPTLNFSEILKAFKLSIFLILKILYNCFFNQDFSIRSYFRMFQCEIFKMTIKRNEIKTYYIPFQGNVIKEPWHIFAEKKGKKVINFNYSSNLDIPSKGYDLFDKHRMRLRSVNNIKIFSKELIKNSCYNNNNFRLTAFKKPPIWYWTSSTLRASFFKNKIVIFDIVPQEPIGITVHTIQMYVRTYEKRITFYKLFFNDILSLCMEKNIDVVLKQKRRGPLMLKEYSSLLFQLENLYSNLTIIDPNVSNELVTSNCIATISQCLTSTPYYQTSNEKNIYYDPTKTLNKKLSNVLNRSIISGKRELSKWIDQVKD